MCTLQKRFSSVLHVHVSRDRPFWLIIEAPMNTHLDGGLMSRPYRADLAYIHDAGHGDFARGAVAWIIGMLRRAEITDGRIVELGCGTGIMTQELTSAGYDVLGIDIAP